MSMKKQNVGILKFFRFELFVHGIGHGRGLDPGGVSHGQINGLSHRKPAPGISQSGHTDIGNTLDNPVVGLGGFGQGGGRKILNNHFPIGSFFNFLTPTFSKLALDMCRWEKIGVSKGGFG